MKLNRLTGCDRYWKVPLLAALAVFIAPVASFGLSGSDPLIEGAKLCTQYFPGQEQKNNIPTHLLAAIATTESGRWHEGLGMNVPWPWTINVEGKGYYFKSKAEAIAQVQRFQAAGRASIDVGCMQVNLKHHPRAFSNLNEAFDPATNVGYAAKFLRDNYAEMGDWIKATAAYHSRTPVYGQRYLGEIERSWNRIVAKVAAARAHESGSPTGVASPSTPAKKMTNTASFQAKPMRQIPSTYNQRVIKVSDDARRSSEVLVIHPPAQLQAVIAQDSASQATLAAAAATSPAAAQAVLSPTSTSTIRRVSLDNGAPSATTSSTRFVFAN